jgi:hypothetical protein
MTAQPSASRRRRFVLDTRLVIGVGLVALSVAGVTGIVAAADRRVTVYAAAETFAPGDHVDADQLLARQVSLDDAQSLYLTAGDLPEGGLVASAVVRRGELIPLAALGTEAGSRSTSVVLALSGEVSASVVAGAVVDVWASSVVSGDGTVGSSGGFGPPTVLTADAIVVRVVEPDGIVSAADGQSVEVLVPRSRIARLLQAIANDDALAVVPAGIPLASR